MFDVRRYARALKLGGYDEVMAKELVEVIAKSNGYDLDTEQALLQTETIYRADRTKGLSQDISDWVAGSQGWWHTRLLDQELHILTQGDKANRRVVLHRLVEAGVLERSPTNTGLYRRVENESAVIEWETADISGVVPLKWPFALENYALMYPKNIGVIAGSSNAGKTAFLLNLIKMNMDRYKIHYYSSEMGPEEMKLRLSKFDVDKWTFDARERSSNFADVIVPNDINIIDYIEITSGEFYRIAEEMRTIFDRLNKGLAIVALQKKKGAELGRGAEFSLEKPRLYLSMETGTLKIIKAKNWAVEGENPNGVEFQFKLINGATFIEGG